MAPLLLSVILVAYLQHSAASDCGTQRLAPCSPGTLQPCVGSLISNALWTLVLLNWWTVHCAAPKWHNGAKGFKEGTIVEEREALLDSFSQLPLASFVCTLEIWQLGPSQWSQSWAWHQVAFLTNLCKNLPCWHFSCCSTWHRVSNLPEAKAVTSSRWCHHKVGAGSLISNGLWICLLPNMARRPAEVGQKKWQQGVHFKEPGHLMLLAGQVARKQNQLGNLW